MALAFRLISALALAALIAIALWWHGSQIREQKQASTIPQPSKSLIEEILDRGFVRVISINAPTTFYVGSHGAQGFEYDLVSAFAEHLGVSVHIEVAENLESVIEAVAKGDADIGAAGIPRMVASERRVQFSPAYLSSVQQVVCRRFRNAPDNVADLVEYDLLVHEGGYGNKRLTQLKQLYPSLTWVASDDSEEQIFDKIVREAVDCTVADSNIVRINQRFYPELRVAFDISTEQKLGWALPPNAVEFSRAIEDWFTQVKQSDQLLEIVARNFDHMKSFDYVDIRVFHRRMKKRLPKLRTYFENAANKYKIPWTVLAAQAYQESHWNPRAKSPTGVRGVMMLTLPTARELGVKNRLDAEQSIMGGSKYLSKLLKRIPRSVKGRDRLWFALAAYNVGMGHVHDAQGLARALNYSADTWTGLKKSLLLLSQEKYFKQLKHGYARGYEAVRYVGQIKVFIEILDRFFGDQPDVSAELPLGTPYGE